MRSAPPVHDVTFRSSVHGDDRFLHAAQERGREAPLVLGAAALGHVPPDDGDLVRTRTKDRAPRRSALPSGRGWSTRRSGVHRPRRPWPRHPACSRPRPGNQVDGRVVRRGPRAAAGGPPFDGAWTSRTRPRRSARTRTSGMAAEERLVAVGQLLQLGRVFDATGRRRVDDPSGDGGGGRQHERAHGRGTEPHLNRQGHDHGPDGRDERGEHDGDARRARRRKRAGPPPGPGTRRPSAPTSRRRSPKQIVGPTATGNTQSSVVGLRRTNTQSAPESMSAATTTSGTGSFRPAPRITREPRKRGPASP